MNLRSLIPSFLRSAPPAVVAKSAFAQAFMTGQDIDGLDSTAGKLIRPYEQSAWVHRAVRLKVDEISRVPLKFYDGKTEFTDAAFLAWWHAPFLSSAGQRLPLLEARRQLASWPDLGGEFFILLGDDWLNPFASRSWKTLSPPIIARPDRMRHIIQGGKIIGWVFTDAGAGQHTLLPEQVIHSPEWNPYDDFRGLATVKVVLNAAEADYNAGLYVRNLMRNNGDQGVFVIGKDGTIDEPQREQIVAALRQKRARALRGDFVPVFLTGNIEVEDPKAQAPDAMFVAGRSANREEVYSGLGVPPSLSTVKASYSIGADSDRFTLITGSAMPLSAKVDAGLARVASLMLGRAITVESDWDDHPVVQEVRRSRIETALKLWAAGMSWEDVNSYLDLGMEPFGGWDIAYIPFSIAPVQAGEPSVPSKPTDPTADDEFSEDEGADLGEEDDQVKSLRLLLLARARSCKRVEKNAAQENDSFAIFACACHGTPGIAQKADRPAKELAQWRTLMTARRGTVKAFQSAIGRVLMAARVETLKKIEASGLGKSGSQLSALSPQLSAKSAATTMLFDLVSFALGFKRATENQQKDGLKIAGQQLFDELGRDDVFSYPPVKVIEYLRARENKLSGVPQEFYDRLKAELEAGLEKGETTAQLAGRAKGIFNDITDGAARTIAITETGSVYGAGRSEAMKAAGVQWKQWLTSGNANVRPAHADANGQTVAADEPFIVDGEELMFPGDDAGSAGNVINCHCVSIAVAEGPEGDA